MNKNLVTVVIVAAAALMTGCAAHQSRPDLLSRVKTIQFPDVLEVPANPEDGSVRDQVLVACHLYRRGDFREACRLFVEADAENLGRGFRRTILQAAAISAVDAGDEKLFHEAVSKLRSLYRPMESLTLASETAVLFALDNRLRGYRTGNISADMPTGVRTLLGKGGSQ